MSDTMRSIAAEDILQTLRLVAKGAVTEAEAMSRLGLDEAEYRIARDVLYRRLILQHTKLDPSTVGWEEENGKITHIWTTDA